MTFYQEGAIFTQPENTKNVQIMEDGKTQQELSLFQKGVIGIPIKWKQIIIFHPALPPRSSGL